jgi:ABC-type amino acid transport substrate-binding protein
MFDPARLLFGPIAIVAALGGCAAGHVSSSKQAPSAPSAPALAPAVTPAQPPAGVRALASAAAPSALPPLRVGTSGDYAPFSSRDAAGNRAGFDVELAQELAGDLGLELTWVPFRWPELGRQLAADEFDVAMGGVTWQPARGVVGYTTRALARGGPCVLGDAAARRVAVNRGGVLEAWARGHLSDRELVTVDDNPSLPGLLAQGRVGAIVTDSFERKWFERPGWGVRCEPPLARKVYWVAPARASELGARIDGWLHDNAARIQSAQQRWFGERQPLDPLAHLVDMIARRFAFMPLVAALKTQKNLPIEDLPREREVLDAVGRSARRFSLPEAPVHELFTLLIELSKAVQRRQSEPSTLDLAGQVRPALSELGERILAALAEARAEHQLGELGPGELELVSPWLDTGERQRLLVALRAVAADG